MKDFVQELIHVHQTSDPYKIARQLNILVIAEPLGKVASYFSPALIHVNSELSEYHQRFAIAYQLYYILKGGTEFNFVFLNNINFENEATQFGVQLLLSA